jgi:hypothetical protein
MESSGLETLLLLDGEVFPMSNGYWTKIESKKVIANEHIPHGIKYSLTLHNRYNKRMIGYDNAHGIKPKRKKFVAKREEKNLLQNEKYGTISIIEVLWKSTNLNQPNSF